MLQQPRRHQQNVPENVTVLRGLQPAQQRGPSQGSTVLLSRAENVHLCGLSPSYPESTGIHVPREAAEALWVTRQGSHTPHIQLWDGPHLGMPQNN